MSTRLEDHNKERREIYILNLEGRSSANDMPCGIKLENGQFQVPAELKISTAINLN
jgi:hypothetical protein